MYFNRQKFNNYSGLLNTTARVWTYSLGEAILSFNIYVCILQWRKKKIIPILMHWGDSHTKKNSIKIYFFDVPLLSPFIHSCLHTYSRNEFWWRMSAKKCYYVAIDVHQTVIPYFDSTLFSPSHHFPSNSRLPLSLHNFLFSLTRRDFN